MDNCKNSNNIVLNHFISADKMVQIGSNTERKIQDYKLSRYACDIFKRKKLRYREDILDNMGSEELADNIIRIAQTDAKLKRDNVDNEYTANSVHYEVGKEERNSIKRLGGTMPENLPTPDKSLKELEKERKTIK